MRFSLVCATVGRTTELDRLCRSLQSQTYRHFELIVVDQNKDDRLTPIITQFSRDFAVRHVRSELGASRARNAGLGCASGDVVAFPDDDCWYPPHLLAQLASLFSSHAQWDGIAGICLDETNTPSINHIDRTRGRITRLNALRRGSAATIFLRCFVAERIGGFDESLGPGANTPWGAAEDLDLVARAAAAGFHLRFLPHVCLRHRQMTVTFDYAARSKHYRYCMGAGRMMRKHAFPLSIVFLSLVANLKSATVAALRGRREHALYHLTACKGLFRGWVGI